MRPAAIRHKPPPIPTARPMIMVVDMLDPELLELLAVTMTTAVIVLVALETPYVCELAPT